MKQLLRLRPKMIFGTMVILFVCLLVAGSFFLDRERSRLQSDIKLQGQSLASLVAQFCAIPIQKYSFYIVQEVARNVEQQPGVAFCEIYDANGESLVQVDSTIHGINRTKKLRKIDEDTVVIEMPILLETEVVGSVEIGLELAPVKEKIRIYIRDLMLAALITMTLVAVCVGVFLSFIFISPVINLSDVTKNLAQGEFVETRVALRSDEIGDLARAFNEMSNKLKQLYQNLEQKVDERTSDLANANQKLQREISVRQKAEHELKSAKEAAERANQYKSNFVANMSHEIRTPLNAILGYAQILQSRDSLDSQDRKALEAIDRGGSHLLGLINDILDLSKIEAGRMELKPTIFDLSLLIRNVASMFQLRCLEKSLTWQVVGLDINEVVPVQADAGKLRQIFINLLGNAVKFTEQGGVVLRVNSNENNRFRFCIEDTGRGIPLDARQNILHPFGALNVEIGSSGDEGTGLGLSITNRFLEIMESKLEVLDNEPHGSRFCFELTLPSASRSSLPVDTVTKKIKGIVTDTPLTALVVDDDKLSRSMLSLLLNNSDVKTIEAQDGVEALKLLTENKPDIIFMDRYMPKMDGIETIRNIDRQYGSNAVPIVMITAAAFESEQDSFDKLGIAGILIKPYKTDEVFECMASALGLSVRFDTAPAAEERAVMLENSLSHADTILPEGLYDRLLSAAEFGKISELKSLYRELKTSANVSPNFLEVISRYIESYDLNAIVRFLTTIKSASPQ